ncbi:MAG: hypothetical protein ABH919_03045 [bacterium]
MKMEALYGFIELVKAIFESEDEDLVQKTNEIIEDLENGPRELVKERLAVEKIVAKI